MIGSRIGHYEIIEKLGEGGMGVVYKAQDTTLERFVALKFLPPHLSASEEDKARFVQEAKAAAALNHPNICTIHGVEQHESQMFIVMEFVEGETLRARGANLPFKKAIEIGIQIADGLAAAHDKGIVHRDLKPDNIIVTAQSTDRPFIKVIDFGIARRCFSQSETWPTLTHAGMVMGTPEYMAPEQLRGEFVDPKKLECSVD